MARCPRTPAARRSAARPALGRAWLRVPLVAALYGAVPAATVHAAVVPAELVARAGDVPAGAAVALASTQPPFVLADGDVAFAGVLADGDAYVFVRDQVVWQGSDELVSVLFGTEPSMGATAAAGFVYAPEVDGAEAVWTHNGLLALEGTQAPAYPMGSVTTFHSRPTMDESGTAWWLAGLNGRGGTTTQQRVLYRSPTASPADIQVELATGDMVGGLQILSPAGLDFDYHVSNAGNHLVMVVLMSTGSTVNDDHVYVDGALFHQENTPNGTGDNWDNFDLVAINDQGTYVFTGDTSGDPNVDEFVAMNGSIAVREGDVLDGVALAAAASLRFVSLDDTGRLVHAWAYAGNTVETVFFACNPADVGGSSLAVLTAGVDELDLDGDGVGDGLVTDLNATSAAGTRALADDGNLYLEVDLDEGAGAVSAMVRLPLSCCGNGMPDDGEECDDGNGDDTDACPGTCMLATCGDGFAWAGVEECDDGDLTNTDACLVGCIAAMCGDGFLWAGIEACDDGNGDDTDGCPGNCMPAECGDGFVWAGVETCDDGDGDDTDDCLSTCDAATCGDGLVWVGVEACDDGNGDDTDDCPGSCMPAMCGDGFVWAENEECDDGNDDDTDGCTSACMLGGATDGSSSSSAESSGAASSSGPGDASTGPGPGSSGTGGQDDTAGTSSGGGGKPPVVTGSSGEPASTGETDHGPFPGLDDDGGCTCVAARERRSGAVGVWLGLAALGLRLRRRIWA
jgi:cysteine-rich repeat protein